MSTYPPDPSGAAVGEAEETYCYGHPDTPTKLRCSRCDRPICGRCAIPASVGQHCPECVAEGRRAQRKARSAMVAQSPAVIAIIVTCVVVFVLQNLAPNLTTRFASIPIAVANGEWWRLITATFLHAPNFFLHIIMNMFALYIFGPNVEELFGSLKFVAIYLAAGFFGSATSYALGPCAVAGVGASGAIFGVIGVLLVVLYKRRRSQFVAASLRQLLFILAINAVIGLLPGLNIDMWAHAGGLAAGIALGAGFDHPRVRHANAIQAVTLVAVVGLAVALVVYRTATFACGPFA